MNRERYTLLVEDNDDRARVLEHTLGDTKPEHPVLRARTVCEALKIIQDSGIRAIDTLVLNPTVGLLSQGEKWGTLGPLYLQKLRENNGRAASGALFFSMLATLFPDVQTQPGLMGKGNILLTSRSPNANKEAQSVSDALHQFNVLTRQALGNVGDRELIETFIKQTKLN